MQIQGRPVPTRAPAPAGRRLWWGGALGIAAAAAVVLVAVGAGRRPAERQAESVPAGADEAAQELAAVVESDGPATMLSAGRVQALEAGLALAPGARVETGAGGSVTIRYRRQTTLALGERAALTLEDPARSRDRMAAIAAQVVHLAAGTLDADIGPQPPDRTLIFLTPHARVTVVGTRLALAVTARETQLEVLAGRVLFERLDEDTAVEVQAGQRALAVAAIPAPADDAPPAPPAPTENVVFAFDFEDGELPATLKQGDLVTGPCRPGSRFCAIGALDPYNWRIFAVAVVGAPVVAYYSEDLILSFDFSAGPEERRIRVQVWNPDRWQNHNLYLPNETPGAWSHASVRLADLAGDRGHAWQPGDRIGNIRVVGGRTGGQPLYVDNIRLFERPRRPGGGP